MADGTEKKKPDVMFDLPKGEDTRAFVAFTADAIRDIGPENPELLTGLNVILNSPSLLEAHLSFTAEKVHDLAKKWCASVRERHPDITDEQLKERRYQFLHELSYAHEYAYRQKYGPGIWNRGEVDVPCPIFLPKHSGQIHEGLKWISDLSKKMFYIPLVAVGGGIFPGSVIVLIDLFDKDGSDLWKLWLAVEGGAVVFLGLTILLCKMIAVIGQGRNNRLKEAPL